MAYAEHGAFKPPTRDNQRIWRYFDFAKFVSTIDKRALYFARLDLLGDPYEGSVSKPTIQAREAAFRQMQQEKDLPEAVLEILLKSAPEFAHDLRRWIFVNCWNMSDYESPALWTIYGKGDKAVALRSTFARLRQAFDIADHSIYIGTVDYVDYDTEYIPAGNVFHPALYKRKGFEHEKELRAATMKIQLKSNNALDIEAIKATRGLYISVDLQTLIERIYVAPTAPDWFLELVQSVVDKYGMNDTKIIRSELALPPSF